MRTRVGCVSVICAIVKFSLLLNRKSKLLDTDSTEQRGSLFYFSIKYPCPISNSDYSASQLGAKFALQAADYFIAQFGRVFVC